MFNTEEIASFEKLYWTGCQIAGIEYNTDDMLDLIRGIRDLSMSDMESRKMFRVVLEGKLPIVFKGGRILVVTSRY
jgi:hypothetical protein